MGKRSRRQSGNFQHMPPGMLVIGICAIAAGGDGFNEMEDFSRAREGAKEILALPHGIPTRARFGVCSST